MYIAGNGGNGGEMDHVTGGIDAEDAEGGRKPEHGWRQRMRVLPGHYPAFPAAFLAVLP